MHSVCVSSQHLISVLFVGIVPNKTKLSIFFVLVQQFLNIQHPISFKCLTANVAYNAILGLALRYLSIIFKAFMVVINQQLVQLWSKIL